MHQNDALKWYISHIFGTSQPHFWWIKQVMRRKSLVLIETVITVDLELSNISLGPLLLTNSRKIIANRKQRATWSLFVYLRWYEKLLFPTQNIQTNNEMLIWDDHIFYKACILSILKSHILKLSRFYLLGCQRFQLLCLCHTNHKYKRIGLFLDSVLSANSPTRLVHTRLNRQCKQSLLKLALNWNLLGS